MRYFCWDLGLVRWWVGLFGDLAVGTPERFVEGEHTGEMGGEATSDGMVGWTGEGVQLIGLAGEGKDGDPVDLTGVEVNTIAGVDMVGVEGKTADVIKFVTLDGEDVEGGEVVEMIGVEGVTTVGVEVIGIDRTIVYGVELMGVDGTTVHGVELIDLEDGGNDGVEFTGQEVTGGWEVPVGVELMKVERLGVELRGVLCLVLRASMTVAKRCLQLPAKKSGNVMLRMI